MVKYLRAVVGAQRAAPLHYIFICGICFFILSFNVIAQEDTSQPIITAKNITRLQSVATIDFDEIGDFETGRFYINDAASRLIVVDQNHTLYLIDDDGEIQDIFDFKTSQDDLGLINDAVISQDSHTIIAAVNGNHIGIRDIASKETVISAAMPSIQSIWLSDDEQTIFYEAVDFNTNIISILGREIAKADEQTIPYGPSADPEALVRIGRIAPPYAVTSSPEGAVKRWNLETGEITAQTEVENGPAVFGQINASGSHFVWRDPMSEYLNLLDFATGDNQRVAPLDGQYVQWFFLSDNADVIIGVYVESQPVIVAWDTETGEKYELGEFRQCSRVPDIARLSKDGTTVIIGCDTGLDIWRISNE